MRKNNEIKNQATSDVVPQAGIIEYISLTDGLAVEESEFIIQKWLSDWETLEFLSVWESANNSQFNHEKSHVIRERAKLDSFVISVEDWIKQTNASGFAIESGHSYKVRAHPDIALEYGMWISPMFAVYVIHEFNRLKTNDNDANQSNKRVCMAEILRRKCHVG